MSQQNRPQRPNKQQQNNPPLDQPLPPQAAPSQPEKIYVERKTNPVMMVLKVIAFPFVKIAQILGNAFAIIFQELVRSIVSLVIGIILIVVFVTLLLGYAYALYLTDFDFAAAVPEMFRVFGSFFSSGA